jgi:hypothetical protein
MNSLAPPAFSKTTGPRDDLGAVNTTIPDETRNTRSPMQVQTQANAAYGGTTIPRWLASFDNRLPAWLVRGILAEQLPSAL